MFQLVSTDHLVNIRKIIDDMALNAAQLQGSAEALRLLFPDFMNNMDNGRIYQSIRQAMGGNGLPLPIWLTEISRLAGEELEKRKGGAK